MMSEPKATHGVPDCEQYRYGYPLTPGRMFGSGN